MFQIFKNVLNIVTVLEIVSKTCLLDGSMGRPAKQVLRTFKRSHMFGKKINIFDFQIPVGWLDMRTAEPRRHLKLSTYCKSDLCFFMFQTFAGSLVGWGLGLHILVIFQMLQMYQVC